MKRMWHKYTPGKRVLALLLAVLMMFDTFTVSAATTEEVSQEVEQEVVVETTESLEPTEENLVEEEITTEEVVEPTETTEIETEVATEVPETEIIEVETTEAKETEVETTENEGTEVVEVDEETLEQLDAGITQDDFKVYVAWNELSSTEPTRIYTSGGTTTVIIEQLETDLSTSTIEVSMINADGTAAELVSTEVNGSYYEYDYYYMTDFAGKTVTVTIDGTTYTYEIEADQLYDMNRYGGSNLITYIVTYDIGDVLDLSTTYVESGVFGYITVSNSQVLNVRVDDMPADAVSEWSANYQSTYGEYGADGKYYFFTYGEETWYPDVECIAAGDESIAYYYMKNGVANEAGSGTIRVTDYVLMYNGTALKADNATNLISYSDGDLVFELYKAGQKVTGGNVTVELNYNDTVLEGAISVVNDETGCYVKIDASEVKDNSGTTIGLENMAHNLYFSININEETGSIYRSFNLTPKGVRINDSAIIGNGGTYELSIDDARSAIYLPIFMSKPAEVTDISLTSSNTAVLDLHGEIRREAYGSDSWIYKGCYMEPKKVGTSEVTVQYKYQDKLDTVTFTVEVVSAGDLNFEFYDTNFEPLPLADGDTYVMEQGATIFADTSISPRVLADIKVTSSDTSIVSTNGSILETVEWTPDGPNIHGEQMAINASERNTGEVTLTLSAKCNGETVTQKITIKVVEPRGVQVRNASSWTDSQGNFIFDVYGNKTTELYIGAGDSIGYQALYDDNAEGESVPANKDNYTFEILKQDGTGAYVTSSDYQIVFVNDYIYYLVPQVDALSSFDWGQKLRITSKTDAANTTDILLTYSEEGMNYLSFNEGKLSDPVNEITLVEGVETTIYFEAYGDQSANYKLESYVTNNGVSMKTELVSEGEWYNVIKATFSYDGTNKNQYTMGVGIINADSDYWATTISINTLNVLLKDLRVPTQREISDFLNATDSSKDIKNVRYNDYEVSYVTQADGAKTVIIVGYLGEAAAISLPSAVVANAILDLESQQQHALSIEKAIPVIGVEDGAFDTRNGYTQPDMVSLYAGYTYFGEDESGLINPKGGRTSFDFWYYTETPPAYKAFETIDGMLFAKKDNGYKCIDTGNLSVAPIIQGEVTLYLNSPNPSSAINLRQSSNVSGYKLASNYLLTEEGTASALRVAVENDKYIVSADSGATVEAGTYYLSLIPQKWFYLTSGVVDLPTIKAKVVVDTKIEAPEVTISNTITMNKYLGTDAITLLNEENSFGAKMTVTLAPDSADKAESLGLSLIPNGDGDYLFYWNGVGNLSTGKVELELQFAVEGFTPTEELYIPNQTVTINVIDVQPQTTASTNKLPFTEYPYVTKAINLDITNGFVNNKIKNFTVEPVSAPKGVDLEKAAEYIAIAPAEVSKNIAVVDVSNDTVPGTYQFAITAELSTEKAQYFAKPVTVTIEVKGTKPTIDFASKVNVTLNSALYYTKEQLPSLVHKSGENYLTVVGVDEYAKATVTSQPKTATDGAVVIRANYSDPVSEDDEYIYYALDNIELLAEVAPNAPVGTYKFNIEVPLMVEGDVVWTSVSASVKVVNKIPTFKISGTSATLDGSYVGSGAGVTLALDPGYILLGVNYVHPTVEAEQCISVSTTTEGGINFTLNRAGITKAGAYKLTPVVMAPNGEIIELKTVNVTVKINNSDKSTLAAKTKTININPYAGDTVVNPQFTAKNVTAQGTVSYEVLPTNELALSTEMNVTITADGNIHVTNCENVANGKYTYNVVQCVGGVYTKPVAITLNVARKALTIAPESSKVTLYADYCNGAPISVGGYSFFYIFAEFPVEIAGAENLNLMDYLAEDASGLTATNDLFEDWAIITYFAESSVAEGETSLVVAIPYGITPNNIVITPNVAEGVNKEFANLKMNITVKAGKPTVKFEESSVTLNRFTTDNVTNTIPDTEGYLMYGMDVTSITMKGKTDNVMGMFDIDTTSDRNSVNIKINPAYVDTIPNGIYVVTAVPTIAFVEGEDLYGASVDPCKFEIKVEDGKPNITVSEKTVNLYPELGGANTANVIVNASVGSTPLIVENLEVSTTGKAAVTDTESANAVAFEVGTDAAKGTNKYNVTAYARRFGGSELVAVGTAKNAVTVNVKVLPKTLKMTSTKLKFNPYLESAVTMTVNDAELKALIASGEYEYSIVPPIEMDSKYQKGVTRNDVLELATAPDGTITITAKNLPTEKATYYYSTTYTIHNVDGTGGDKNYEVKFSVAVENKLPTAQLSAKSVTLNNAYLEQTAYSNITLKTGADVWSMAEINENYKVLDGKKQDVTDKFTVSIINGQIAITPRAYDGAGNPIEVPKGNYTLSLIPMVTNGRETIELAEVKVTVKVVSSKPAYVKSSVSLTVNTWSNDAVKTQVALKNGEAFVLGTQIECTKAPKNADVDAIHVGFTTDGTLSVYADRDAVAGNYTYSVKPVTTINGYKVVLDPLKVTVKVDTKQPKAVVSDKGVATVNTEFAGVYSKDLVLSLSGVSRYEFTFTKDDIKTTEKKAANVENANKLLDAMMLTTNPDGSVSINVNLNGEAASVPKGTYKFALKPTVKTGNYMSETDEAYSLGEIKFSVKVENTMPKVTAKATGSIELLKRNTSEASVQLSFNKQNYETVDNIVNVRLLENGEEYNSQQFYVSDTSELASGKFTVKAYEWASIAAKNQSVTVEVTTASGNVYTTKVTIKVSQANVKITAAKTATYYADADIAEIPVTISDEEVSLGYARLTAVSLGNKKLDVNDFDCNVGYYNGPIIQLQANDDMSEHVGKTLKCTFEVEPYGIASNKKPVKVTVNVVIE